MFFTLKRSRRRDPSQPRDGEVKAKVINSSSIRGPIVHDPCHYHGETTSSRVPRHTRTDSRSLFRKVHFIHLFPREILAHIFLLGEEDNEMFPIVVSEVCRTWRELAIRTPALWRRIVLSRRGDMWMERINRARACPLDVQLRPYTTSIRGGHRMQKLDMHSTQWYMHLVTPFISRWRSLEITFASYSPFLWNVSLDGCCGTGRRYHAPMIEEISLIHPTNDDSKEFTLFGGVAPRLRKVTVDGIRLTWLPSLFANLTSLNYTHHGFTRGRHAVSEILSILDVSNALTELHILFPDKLSSKSHRYHTPTTMPLVLPSLAQLHLNTDGRDIPNELLSLISNISTPNLLSLTLNDFSHSHATFPRLEMFFKAFFLPQTLRRLRVESGWNNPDMIPVLVTRLPKLEQYVIGLRGFPDQFVDLLGWRRSMRRPLDPRTYRPRYGR